jgi:multiple sugar transport system permease protein
MRAVTRWLEQIGLVLASVVCIDAALAQTTEPAPPLRGTLLQNPPQKLGSYAPSDLISSVTDGYISQWVLEHAFSPNCSVDVYQLKYQTVGGQGEPTTASGALMIPVGSDGACTGPRPVALYAHGKRNLRSFNMADLGGHNYEGLIVALALALLLNLKIRGQTIYRTIIFLPSLVPVVASAMVWLWLFNQRLGLLNYGLGLIGIEGPGWLSDAKWAMPSLAFMSLWGVGNTVIIYLAGLQDVPQELYEAAEIDGANRWQRLWHVTIPMISPVIFFNLIMAIIGTWQVFTVPFIMTGGSGGSDYSTLFYTMYLYSNAFSYLRMGYASAMAWIQLLIILAFTALAFWTSSKWVHYQGN